jgi:hypothetical protein
VIRQRGFASKALDYSGFAAKFNDRHAIDFLSKSAPNFAAARAWHRVHHFWVAFLHSKPRLVALDSFSESF